MSMLPDRTLRNQNLGTHQHLSFGSSWKHKLCSYQRSQFPKHATTQITKVWVSELWTQLPRLPKSLCVKNCVVNNTHQTEYWHSKCPMALESDTPTNSAVKERMTIAISKTKLYEKPEFFKIFAHAGLWNIQNHKRSNKRRRAWRTLQKQGMTLSKSPIYGNNDCYWIHAIILNAVCKACPTIASTKGPKVGSFRWATSYSVGQCDGCTFKCWPVVIGERLQILKLDKWCEGTIFATIRRLSNCTYAKQWGSKVSKAFGFGRLNFSDPWLQSSMMKPWLCQGLETGPL